MHETHIIDPVSHHDESVEPNVDVETGPPLRVKPASAQDVRVRTTPRHHLKPAYVTAGTATAADADLAPHINLETRLDERKEARPHSRQNRPAENGVEDRGHQKLASGERYVLVDDEYLVLKNARSCRVSVLSFRYARPG